MWCPAATCREVTRSFLLPILQNVAWPIVGPAVGDTAAKWPAIMAPSAPDGNIVQCVDGENLHGAPLVGTAMCWPVGAVHMAAGHNALHGSGPSQEPAFDDALARVGCPDRWIDRLCIMCCSPFPTFRLCRTSARSRSRRRQRSYAEFWVMRRSGGAGCRHLVDLEAICESYTCHDFWQLICSVQPPPSF